MIKEPLAYRMRPQKIEQVVGQHHLLGKGKIINRMVKANMLTSMILYGPPGTGKTSIAEALAGSSKLPLVEMNAANQGKRDLKKAAKKAKKDGTTLLFIDEIHRLTRNNQDYLLSLTESGNIILIGATTENPYLNLNPALRSRVHIFEVHKLSNQDIKAAIKRAITNKTRGLGKYPVKLDKDALRLLCDRSNGDLRKSLNALELAVKSTPRDKNNQIHVKLQDIEECIQQKAVDTGSGDSHYDLVSALQKSIRGSDVDAALYYAAELINSGDMESITRRLSVIPYEDVGLANPKACTFTTQAITAAERLGLPEGRIPLADAIIVLCLSPKSNTGMNALDHAIVTIRHGGVQKIPQSLQDDSFSDEKKLGHGIGYKYSHDYPYDFVKENFMPNGLHNAQFYRPKSNGKEKALGKRYENLRHALGKDIAHRKPWLHWLF